jgi:hypothetical protein
LNAYLQAVLEIESLCRRSYMISIGLMSVVKSAVRKLSAERIIYLKGINSAAQGLEPIYFFNSDRPWAAI